MKIQSFLTLAATAAFITSASASITMDWVNVGHAGNAADTTGRGAVAYAYQIGKYEVTNAQYGAFLNAVDPEGTNANGIYNTNMGTNALGGITYNSGAASGVKYTLRTNMGNKPVNFVSWYDAARFANWMMNGQGSGSTETGAYTLNGNTGIITRNVGANVYLPSDDEWYKAAYYDPTPGAGGGDNYWLYPTRSNTAPIKASANNSTGDISNPGANVANYANGASGLTTVGSAGALAESNFGTADQAGNVSEWNEAVIFDVAREVRGGAYNTSSSNLSATIRQTYEPATELVNFGFRVASVPEPTSIVLTMLASGVMLIRRKR